MLSRFFRPTASAINQFAAVTVLAPQGQASNAILGMSIRSLTSVSKPANQAASGFKEGPERDLVNFPRPTRLVHPPPVKLGFLPEDWFKFFYSKTGVTGPWTFGVGLVTYVLSKEIWVLEHEFWNGVSLFMIVIYAAKKFGPQLAAYLDKEQDEYLENLNSGKKSEIDEMTQNIEEEKRSQVEAEGMKMLFDVKRENVALQLESVYRQRIMNVYNEVKKRLDYQLAVQQVETNMQQKHMVNWIIDNVRKSITVESEAENLKKCIADLKGLSAKY